MNTTCLGNLMDLSKFAGQTLQITGDLTDTDLSLLHDLSERLLASDQQVCLYDGNNAWSQRLSMMVLKPERSCDLFLKRTHFNPHRMMLWCAS